MSRLLVWWGALGLVVCQASYLPQVANYQELNQATDTLGCRQQDYSYQVTQTDSQGKVCWDRVTVTSCYGRCDSNEISDWRFPYKRSYHPVCLYGEREVKTVVLRHCEEGAEPGTEVHRFVSAVSCRCHVCKSSEASCQALGGHIAGSDSWKQAKIVEMQQIP